MSDAEEDNTTPLALLLEKVGARVIPGDVVGRVSTEIKIGPGLVQDRSNIIATKAGLLLHKSPEKFWVENSQRRV